MYCFKVFYLSFAIFSFVVGPGVAQDVREHDPQNMRPIDGGAPQVRRSFGPDEDAVRILKLVLAAGGFAGMEDRITIRESEELQGAVASIQKHERLIIYGKAWMRSVAAKADTCWSNMAIFAHEVAHHMRLHMDIPNDDRAINHKVELEADYQSGFILRRMGAALVDAQSVYRTFGEAATGRHPARAARVEAVTSGWKDGGGSAGDGLLPAVVCDKRFRVDFSEGAKGEKPRYLVAAQPFLRKGQIAISVENRVPPGSGIAFVNNLGLYEGRAVEPTVSDNFLTQIDTNNVPASFTLVFSKPLKSFTFLVPMLWPATASGITFPAWKATALDPSGGTLASVSEKLLAGPRGYRDVNRRTYTLSAPAADGIAAVRFDSDPTHNGRPFAAFSTILIEQIILEEK